MNKIRILTMLSAIALSAVFTAHARADEWNKLTKITISEPIEVPGTVLQPGTYMFQLLDSAADRHVVQIFNANRMHLYATVMAIDTERVNVTPDTVFTFYETPAGQPRAVKYWYYPGEEFGQEFIYKKGRPVELSKASQPVQTAQNTPPPPPEPAVAAAPAPEPAPAPAAPEVAQNEPPAAAPPAPAPAPETPAQPVLPKTASNIPLLALIGLLSLGMAAGLGVAAKKVG